MAHGDSTNETAFEAPGHYRLVHFQNANTPYKPDNLQFNLFTIIRRMDVIGEHAL